MSKPQTERMVGARVAPELEKQIEKFRERLEKKAPGSRPSMSDAVRALIVSGLAAEKA